MDTTQHNTTKTILESVEKIFTLPKRDTNIWEENHALSVINKDLVIKVAMGKAPVGILPYELITEEERLKFLEVIHTLSVRQYNNTNEFEKVMVHGHPYVDFQSLTAYLNQENDPIFNTVRQPLLNRLIAFFVSLGFEVHPLTDRKTGLPYKAGVVRQIHMPKNCFKEDGKICTVLHCDDFLRDSFNKTDFNMPIDFEGYEYHQFSICLQLEDGGYAPDFLHVYEKKYSAELEPYFFGEGRWRYPNEKLLNIRKYSHVPKLKETYFFSTLNFHDVQGGHPLSNRINFSTFFLYLPELNRLYYYN